MGKKAHPAGIRIDFNGWKDSVWFDRKNLAKGIKEDFFIRKIAFNFYKNEILCNVTIERNFGFIVINLHTHRPSVLIGPKGVNITKIKEKIEKDLDVKVKINVVEIFKPEINAQFVCDQIVKQLITRGDYKKAAKSCIKFAMKSSNVKGIAIAVSGRLNGSSIARVEKFRKGSVAMQTFRDNIIYQNKPAKTIYGICGVKVFISYNKIGINSNRSQIFNKTNQVGGKDVNVTEGI